METAAIRLSYGDTVTQVFLQLLAATECYGAAIFRTSAPST